MSINEVDAFEAKANSKDPLVNEGDLEEDNDEDEPYVDPDTIQRDGMFQIHVNAYSVGHYFNDLCACMWFVYLTWYLINIVKLSHNVAGLCVLSGQVADGICTPITGLLSDKYNTKCGKRYPWYVLGTIIVFPCFLGIFSYEPFVNEINKQTGKVSDKGFQTAWYLTLPALFNIGWAMVQISHMAIVNSLSHSNRKRDQMVNQRNGFTFMANITVLTAALIVFSYVDSGITQFRILLAIVLCMGSCTSIFFMVTIREPTLAAMATKLEREYKIQTLGEELFAEEEAAKAKDNAVGKTPTDWLKDANFYVHGAVYMMTRIAVNVTMTVQPFYLQNSLKFQGDGTSPSPIEIASVPLGSYITSLIFSVYFQQPMTRYLRNRMYPMFVSIVVIVLSSVPLIYLTINTRLWVYPCVAIQGIGLSIMLNTATSLISDVIGSDSEGSAFVYGVYSLFDKFANGFILYYIVATFPGNDWALRYIIGIAPIICVVLSYILTFIGQKYFSHKLAKITGIKQSK